VKTSTVPKTEAADRHTKSLILARATLPTVYLRAQQPGYEKTDLISAHWEPPDRTQQLCLIQTLKALLLSTSYIGSSTSSHSDHAVSGSLTPLGTLMEAQQASNAWPVNAPAGRRGVQTTSSEIPSGLGGNRQKQQKQAGDKARVRASHSGSSEGISGQHDRSVLTFGAGEGSAGSPDVRRKPSHHGPGRSQAAQQQDKGRKRARTSPDTAAGQERAQQQKPPPPPPVPAEDPFKDRPPLEAAAAHASVALRTRLRELHASPQPKAATIGAGEECDCC
jgi:hypothetical protein